MIDFRFLLVTDRTRCAPRKVASVVHDAVASGVRAVQLREKDLNPADLVSLATRLVGVLRPKGGKLIVNVSEAVDDDTAALLAGSPGVDGFHVPDQPDLLTRVRDAFPALLVGASTHDADAVRKAAAAGADYVIFGPVYATASKQRFGKPIGIEALRAACASTDVPVFAIGGVTPERAPECIAAGAHGVAAIGAVMTASSPRSAVRAFAESMGGL